MRIGRAWKYKVINHIILSQGDPCDVTVIPVKSVVKVNGSNLSLLWVNWSVRPGGGSGGLWVGRPFLWALRPSTEQFQFLAVN